MEARAVRPARVIVIDDPTPYRNRHSERKDGGRTRFGIGVADRYSRGVMTEKDLVALGPLIRAIAAPDAYIFCWATRPNMDMAIRVLRGRGLRYVTIPFTWEKLYPGGGTFKGTGRYNFSNPEDVILARYPGTRCWHSSRGWKPHAVFRTLHPRYESLPHSRKPEEIQDAIDRWLDPHLGDHDKVELFATRQRPGWTCLGYDVTGRDIREDLEILARSVGPVVQ